MEGMSSNAFKAVMDIDVLGTFNTIKATIPHLLRSRDARIIYVSATFHYTGMPFQAHVSAAKASVDSLCASVALEYGPRGVQSNVISPGPIEGTEGMDRLAGKDVGPQFVQQIPSGRLGTVRDIADTTVFLFSEGASYINGQIIPVDGGQWRRQAAMTVGISSDLQYPNFLLDEGASISKDLKTDRKSKL